MLNRHHSVDVSRLAPDELHSADKQRADRLMHGQRRCKVVSERESKSKVHRSVFNSFLANLSWNQTLLVKLELSNDQTLLHYILRHCST